MTWTIIISQFLVGIICLSWGATRFIKAATSLAHHRQWSPMLTGMLLVGFGTSFPELAVSLLAALKGNAGLSIGNAIGSNTVNIGLCAGISAIIAPVTVEPRLIRYELPILCLVTAVVGVLICNAYLSPADGVILLSMLGAYVLWMIHSESKHPSQNIAADNTAEEYYTTQRRAAIWWLLGLIIIFLSSEIMINSAIRAAHLLHMSDFVIGITIVAIGTSLPELAATIVSTIRGAHTIAIGNVIGSSIFNLLIVLPIPAILTPTVLPTALLSRDYWVVCLFSGLLWLFAWLSRSKNKTVISRAEGVVLVVGFMAYIAFMLLN